MLIPSSRGSPFRSEERRVGISLSMRLDDDGSSEKKVPGAGAPKSAAPRREQQDRPRRDHGDRPRRDDRKSTGRSDEFAPGTIGYMLAHQKKK